ncbi:uncharacterized protein LOC135821111 isoform X3 [Sycon ciliatum]|uniref:uncharacterized protein LOC135821111 isoform X3 n=1 Tax=Sycon ciliatum TaxID=27933 RepID=UPI0031F6D07F
MMDGIASSYNDMSDSESDDDKKQTVPNVAHAACIAHQAHYLAAASAESAAGSRQCARAGDTAEQEAINVQSGQAATVSKLPPSSRKIVPCKALLDDDTQHDDCSQQYVRSEASVTALLLAQRQVPPPSTAASSTADDESRAAVSVQVIEGNDISINRILSRPPVHIASLLSTSPGHRPGCRPPRRKIHSFSGHTASVMKLAWHCPGGQILASCGMDGLLCFWEPWVKRQCVKKMSPHKSLAIRCGMWYSTGSAGITTRNSGTGVADAASNPVHFLSGGYDKCLRLLDVEYDKCVVSLLHPHHVTAVARHPTHRSVVVTGTSQCSLAAWDVQSGKVHLKNFTIAHRRQGRCRIFCFYRTMSVLSWLATRTGAVMLISHWVFGTLPLACAYWSSYTLNHIHVLVCVWTRLRRTSWPNPMLGIQLFFKPVHPTDSISSRDSTSIRYLVILWG